MLQLASWTTDSQEKKGGKEGGKKEGRERKKEKGKDRERQKKTKERKQKPWLVTFANFSVATTPTMANSSYQNSVTECELGKRHDNWLYYNLYHLIIYFSFVGKSSQLYNYYCSYRKSIYLYRYAFWLFCGKKNCILFSGPVTQLAQLKQLP